MRRIVQISTRLLSQLRSLMKQYGIPYINTDFYGTIETETSLEMRRFNDAYIDQQYVDNFHMILKERRAALEKEFEKCIAVLETAPQYIQESDIQSCMFKLAEQHIEQRFREVLRVPVTHIITSHKLCEQLAELQKLCGPETSVRLVLCDDGRYYDVHITRYYARVVDTAKISKQIEVSFELSDQQMELAAHIVSQATGYVSKSLN